MRSDVAGHLMVEASGMRSDVGGHLMVEATGMRSDIGGHLMVEASGMRKNVLRHEIELAFQRGDFGLAFHLIDLLDD